MKKVRIQNFQAHQDLTIEFGQITTIVGPSDVGKSAILRALRWVMKNEPKGTGFIREGTTTATVTLEVDGRTIIRKRHGETINLYQMDDAEFKAFGNEVPSDIAAFLNVTELNFQSQHDSPFWFTETAGELSRRLNQIVDLSQIDTTLAAIDGTTRRTRTEVEVIKERREKIKAEGMKLKWTLTAHRKLSAVEKLEEAWQETADDTARLGELVGTVESYQDAAKSAIQRLSHGEKPLKAGEAWRKTRQRVDDLETRLRLIDDLTETANLEAPSLRPLEELEQAWKKTSERRQALERSVRGLVRLEASCQQENELRSLEARLKKEMGDRCPLCNSVIKS